MNKDSPKQTPLEDLKQSALNDYEKASSAIHHHNSDIPKAIRFYYNTLIANESQTKRTGKALIFFFWFFVVIFFIIAIINLVK